MNLLVVPTCREQLAKDRGFLTFYQQRFIEYVVIPFMGITYSFPGYLGRTLVRSCLSLLFKSVKGGA